MTTRSGSGPALPVRQHTVARSAEWRGERRRRRTDVLVVHPAEADTGIRFLRLGDAPSAAIPARWDAVVDARCGLVLGNAHGATLHGVTPLLAALRVAGVDNAVVEVQGSRITADAGDFALYLDILADVGGRPRTGRAGCCASSTWSRSATASGTRRCVAVALVSRLRQRDHRPAGRTC